MNDLKASKRIKVLCEQHLYYTAKHVAITYLNNEALILAKEMIDLSQSQYESDKIMETLCSP